MSHSKNDRNKIFTWKKIQTYLKIERRGKDAHELEKTASEDPFLSDAIEGYESSKNDPVHNSRLKEIEDYVRYRKSQEKGESVNTKRIIAIAASFAVLISASLWIWYSLPDLRDQNLGDVPQIEKSEEKSTTDQKRQDEQGEAEIDMEEKSVPESESEESIETIEAEPNVVAEAKEEDKPEDDQIVKPSQESSAGQAYTASDASRIEENRDKGEILDNLISKIIKMEREFLEQERLNSLAMNEPQEEILTDQAPASREMSNEDEEELQKRKSKKSRSTAGAAGNPKTENKIEAMRSEAETSTFDSQVQKDLELKTDSLEGKTKSNLILAIDKLYAQDTAKALNQLKTVIPRSDSQKVLLDSLILKLSR